MIDTPELLLCKIAKILETLEITYAVTGGFAVSIWGRPRFTADIDIVVELVSKNIKPLTETLLSIDKAAYVSEEAMRDALEHKGEFNFIHPNTNMKVDFWVRGSKADIYGKLKFERARIKKINNQEIYFVSPEDLILSKLAWSKESESTRHLEDIKSIIDIQQSKLDLDYIKKWARRQSTTETLEEILKSNSKL